MSDSNSFLRAFVEDGFRFGLLATMAVAAGFGINQLRDNPLPMRYEGKKERIAAAAERLAPGTPKPAAAPAEGLPAEIGFDQFKAIVDGKKVTVLDARPEIFHRLGHVPGAISLPREEFETAYQKLQDQIGKDLSAPLVVYCSGSSCEDSELVRTALLKVGHTNVAVFRGGWSEWTNAGLPEEKQ